MTTPYQEAIEFIRRNPGTSSSTGMAKLILSLYNSVHSFGIGECLSSFDRDRLNLAVSMIQHYGAYGEDESLIKAGEEIYEKWPRLIELSNAARDAKADVREKWSREESARFANQDE